MSDFGLDLHACSYIFTRLEPIYFKTVLKLPACVCSSSHAACVESAQQTVDNETDTLHRPLGSHHWHQSDR